MGIVDWEPRALPSEARCERWAKQGGAFLACDVNGAVMVMPSPVEPREYAFAASSAGGGVRVRPWIEGEPAGWNATFYPMTHPPIPEGLERIGEWRTGLGAPRDLPLVFLEDGTIMRDPGLILGSVWFCEVRRVAPPADWGDVPKGVELFRAQTIGFEDRLCVVWGGNFYGMVWKLNNTWETKSAGGVGGLQVSLPAAIVALTGRRE